MDKTKDDIYYVKKIMTDLYFIKDHISGVAKSELEHNEILLDSMLFRLIQVCENTKKLTDDYKISRCDIPWRDIAGLRNRLVHDYGNVDLEIVYETLAVDMPMLIRMFESCSI